MRLSALGQASGVRRQLELRTAGLIVAEHSGVRSPCGSQPWGLVGSGLGGQVSLRLSMALKWPGSRMVQQKPWGEKPWGEASGVRSPCGSQPWGLGGGLGGQGSWGGSWGHGGVMGSWGGHGVMGGSWGHGGVMGGHGVMGVRSPRELTQESEVRTEKSGLEKSRKSRVRSPLGCLYSAYYPDLLAAPSRSITLTCSRHSWALSGWRRPLLRTDHSRAGSGGVCPDARKGVGRLERQAVRSITARLSCIRLFGASGRPIPTRLVWPICRNPRFMPGPRLHVAAIGHPSIATATPGTTRR